MAAIVGVRAGDRVRYSSVRTDYGLARELVGWAQDEAKAAALIAFGPFHSIGAATLERCTGEHPANGQDCVSGEIAGGDDLYIRAAMREHGATTVALYDESAGGWRVWPVWRAIALRALARAQPQVTEARDLAGRGLRLLDASERMGSRAGAGARHEVRETAAQAGQALKAAHRQLEGRHTRIVGALALRQARHCFSRASEQRTTAGLRSELSGGVEAVAGFLGQVELARVELEERIGGLPEAALERLPDEAAGGRPGGNG